MAKGKHATALFEVIHSNRKFSGDAGRAALKTPKWWFKSRSAPGEPARSLAPPAPPFDATTDVEEIVSDPAAEVPHIAMPPDRPSLAEATQSKPPLGRSSIEFHFDRDRHEMTLRLRYTTAIVTGFAIMVAWGLAYAMGRHIAGGPPTASASPTADQLLSAPAHPDVLNVEKHPAHDGASGVMPGPATVEGSTSRGQEVSVPPVGAPTGGVTDGHRVVHTNYVIVQSYPTQKGAMEARDFLVKAGIPCTAEKAPPGYTADPNWYSVITTTGFQHPRAPEGEAYLRSIEKAGEKFAGNSRFKRFEPHWYSWR